MLASRTPDFRSAVHRYCLSTASPGAYLASGIVGTSCRRANSFSLPAARLRLLHPPFTFDAAVELEIFFYTSDVGSTLGGNLCEGRPGDFRYYSDPALTDRLLDEFLAKRVNADLIKIAIGMETGVPNRRRLLRCRTKRAA